jgi:hypothetical protein
VCKSSDQNEKTEELLVLSFVLQEEAKRFENIKIYFAFLLFICYILLAISCMGFIFAAVLSTPSVLNIFFTFVWKILFHILFLAVFF